MRLDSLTTFERREMTEMTVNENFAKWATSYSGCDGGDIGSPARPAIWFCGIEWGGGRDAGHLAKEITRDVSQPPPGYPHWEHNLAYRFHQQASKLLAAIAGHPVANTRHFLQQAQPFCQNSGYFKLNLFPVAFKDTNHARWQADYAAVTGLASKQDYLDWCRQHRLAALRARAAEHRPRLIVCVGKTFVQDFKRAFLDNHEVFMQRKPIAGLELLYKRNAEGALVVVLPFMINRNGLTRNDSIQQFGDQIAQLMEQHGRQ